MHILLFIIYCIILGYGVFRVPFLRNSGIRPGWLLLFFALHVMVGCLHTVIAWRFYPDHGDIWDFFHRSFVTRHQLTSDFPVFISDNATWNYVTHNGIVMVNVLLNILSFDDLYINTLLFSFPVFLGNIALFRVFRRQFPGDPLTALSALVFPSALFWTSCIHREGAIYCLLGFFFYYADLALTNRADLALANRPAPPPGNGPAPHLQAAPRRRWLFYCILLFAGLVYFRPAIAFSLFPAAWVWWLMERPSRQKEWITAAGVMGLLLLFIIFPGFSSLLPRAMSIRQQEYQLLEGGSKLFLPALEPSWSSILHVLPTALRNGLFEPLPGSGGKSIYLVFALELVGVWLIILGASLLSLTGAKSPEPRDPVAGGPLPLGKDQVIKSHLLKPTFSPFAKACLVFSLTGLLLIGLIIPFAGAIVRYRSIFLPFLLAPFLHCLRTTVLIKRLNRWLSLYIYRPFP